MSQKKTKTLSSFEDLASSLNLSKTESNESNLKNENTTAVSEQKNDSFKEKKLNNDSIEKKTDKKSKKIIKNKPKRKLIRFRHDSFNEIKSKASDHFRDMQYQESIKELTTALDMVTQFVTESRNEGEHQKNNGHLDAALKEYKEAKKVFKKLIPIFYLRGVAYLKLKNYSASMQDFDMLIKYQPFHRKAYMKRAQIKERLGDFEGVILDLNELIKIEPNNSTFYYKLANIYLIKDKVEDAIKKYQVAFSKDRESPRQLYKKGKALFKKGKIDIALKEFNHSLTKFDVILKKILKHSKDQFDEKLLMKKLDFPIEYLYLYRAEIKFKKGQVSSAEKDLNKVLENNPNQLKARNHRAEVLKDKQDYINASKDYSYLIEHNTDSKKLCQLYIKRAYVNSEAKQYEQAIEDYKKAIEIEPFQIPLYLKLSDVFQKTHQYEESLKHINKVIEFKPKDSDLYFKRALLHKKNETIDEYIKDLKLCYQYNDHSPYNLSEKLKTAENIKNNQKSIILIDQAFHFSNHIKTLIDHQIGQEVKFLYDKKQLTIDEINSSLLFVKGQFYIKEKKYNEAINDLSNALQKEQSHNANLYYSRAFAYYESKVYNNALKDIKKALEFEPKNDQYYILRAKIYAQKKDQDSAVKDYNKAIKLNPNSSMNHAYLGEFLFQQELYDGALFSLKKSLEKDRSNVFSLRVLSKIYSINQKSTLHDKKEALKLASRACEIEPNNIDNNRVLAIAYSMNDDFENAIHTQERVYQTTTLKNDKNLLEHYQSKKDYVSFLTL